MTVDEIKARVEEIARERDDDERAHGMEDKLWEDVLQAIAEGHSAPAEIARQALASRAIKFSRWGA